MSKRTFTCITQLISLGALMAASCASFAQTPTPADIEVLHPQLTLMEGETATLELFDAPSAPTSPATVTLTIAGSAEQFLSVDPKELRVSEAGKLMASIMAIDNEDVNGVRVVNIMLSVAGDNVRLTPTQTIAVSIEDDDTYTINFDLHALTIVEGLNTDIQLSISPAPLDANTVAVALSVSDDEQISVAPERVVFSAASTRFDVVVGATEDAIPELQKTFTVSLTPDVPAIIVDLPVTVPADSDTPIVRVFAEKNVIPEGTSSSFLIEAILNQDLDIGINVSGPTGSQIRVRTSPPFLTLSADNPSAPFSILAIEDDEQQGASITFNVDLTTSFTPQPELPSLTFTIPPNDLTAHAARPIEFTLENKEIIQTMTVNITPPLQGDKSFIVSSDDPRLIVKTGLITPDRPPFSVELALSEDAVLGREDRLSLTVSHLDSWQPFAQAGAQAQIDAGFRHSCGITADNTVACWGDNSNDQADPTSAAGVDANTSFLAVSAGESHTCGIKADSAVACWGNNASDQSNPASAPQGVDANAKFLSVSSGLLHSCAIKADNTVACWGFPGDGRLDLTSSHGGGANNNTRFLSVSAGGVHNCGIKADSRAACWGTNADNRANPASAAGVDADTRFLGISAGRSHSCGIKVDGRMACWGLPDNGRTDPTSAAGVDADTRFLAVSAGESHTCGIKADSAVACWGLDDDDQANPTNASGVDADTRFLAVSAGHFHTCGIKADSAVACWGLDDDDQTNPASAAGIDADTRFLAVSAGHFHTCGIKADDGAAACWGRDDSGQSSPPSNGFAQTPDVFRLAEQITALIAQDNRRPVQLKEVTEVEVLHPRLRVMEGETATLTLFKALNSPTSPVTITLEVEESGEQTISISPEQLVLDEAGETATVSITVADDDDFAYIDPISVMMSITGDNTRLTPTETITAIVENDDFYTIGFDREEITLEEGTSTNVRLSIDPTPSGGNTAAVALSVSDNEQLTVSPKEVVFSAASTGFDVVVAVAEDAIPELEETFAVSLAPSAADIPIEISSMSVIVPADNDITVRAMAERTVIPEGTVASVLIDAALGRELTINMAVSGLTGAQTDVSLSSTSLRLSPDKPSTLFNVLVADNDERQAANRTFNVDLSAEFMPKPDLPSLRFVIPPNDLTANAIARAEFTPDNDNAIQTMVVKITPPLRDDKSFVIFSENPRLAVKTGVIASRQSLFPVELGLSEDTILGQEERLSLSISHLDSWQQRSAQAQLSVGVIHSCGIKADGAVACWGSDDLNRDNPLSAAGVDANARFLSLSAGYRHNCAVKADNTLACWGDNKSDQANPASAAGVDADTGFLAVSAGSSHSCGIKADNTVACWGFDGYGRADPASAAGVNAGTKFLALSAGNAHTCGIKADSAAVCWGLDSFGRANPASAVGVGAGTRFLAISAGHSHTCGIKADGAVVCWGFDDNNQASPASAPGVDADTRFLAVSAGRSHSCGIKTDGAVACWGLDGNNQASPPPNGFARTPDVFRLAEKTAPLTTQEGERAVRLERNIEFLHPQLTLREGETTTLALFSLLSAPASPITVTLEVGESDRRFLSFNPAQFTISEAGDVMTSITAADDEDIAVIDPIAVALRIKDSALPSADPIAVALRARDSDLPVSIGMSTVTVINNDYAIDFLDRRTITLKEGMSADVRLKVEPAPLGANRVTATFMISESDQIAVNPPRLVFTRTNTNTVITVSAKEDNIAEPEKTFAVSLLFETDTAAEVSPDLIGSQLSVIVPADEAAVRVLADRTIIPEGAMASVLVDAFVPHDLNISLSLSGLAGSRAGVSLSNPSIRLGADRPSASFNVFVEDNGEPQAGNRTFNVDLSATPALQTELPSLAFIIPPNDLAAHAATRVEFTLGEPERTMTVNITPPPQGSKSFIVSSEDPRLIVNTGLITAAQSPFPVELALSEGALLGEGGRLSLNISHADVWRQRGAQAQLSAGPFHACGIRADNAAVCWGDNSDGQSNSTSVSGVGADTRFLAVSAGARHSCGIKADNAAVCWGFDGSGQTGPTGRPQGADALFAISAGRHHTCAIKADSSAVCWGGDGRGQSSPTSVAGVNADTRFLAVSAGAHHSCGIRADNTAVCWGADNRGQASPTGSPQGVDANTRFLALSAGDFHTCAIRADSSAVCWGHNIHSQSSPTSVAGIGADTRFLAISAGARHSCGIKANGEAVCWGFYGHSLSDPINSRQGIDADTRFLAVSAGDNYSCALKTDGAVACWGADSLNQASPPPDSFSRAHDVVGLAERTAPLRTRDGDEGAVRLERSLEILRPQLALREGESVSLALLRALRDPASTITVTLEIREPDERFLSADPARFAISEAGEIMTTIAAIDNDDFADIEPIDIALIITGDNIALTETITVSVENDDIYAIGFDREMIIVEEGTSATARLSIAPTPANSVAVALSVSGNGQIATDPSDEVIFSTANTNTVVVVTATNDDVAEPEKTFTVSLAPPQGVSAMASSMSVTVPADNDTPTARVSVGRAVVPEGAAVSILIDADLSQELTINMAASGLTGGTVELSLPSLTLSPNAPQASFSVMVADNGEPQADSRTFNVSLSAASELQIEPPSLTFAVPPNDLRSRAAMRAEFKVEETERTLTINITPSLQDDKSFVVFSEDPRLIVKTGIITRAQSPFPVELALSEDVVLGKEERLSLNIAHLDSWRQRSAQAQLSAGDDHNCGIKADNTAVCWGNGGNNRSNPASAAGVDANTGFLAVSAGAAHSCGIKADNTAVCWGFDNYGQSSPTSAAGVDANTRFLALSAGRSHTCGIKADSAVACWGSDDYGQSSPPAGLRGANAFLAVSAGALHSCGIRIDSAAICWGHNANNEANPLSADGVDANTRFLAVSAGNFHSCGIKEDNTAVCWGFGGNGQTDPTASPQGVDADTGFLALSAGGGSLSAHTCGIKIDGGAACWGLNDDKQSDPTSAEGVDADTKFLAVSAGTIHSCGIKADGAAVCWGFDGDGQSSPPADSLKQTLDVLRLAERATALTSLDGEEPVQFNEVTDVAVLRPQLTIREGETVTLPLFRALSGPANLITITLTVEDSGMPSISVSPTQLVIDEEGGTATASITAIDDDDFADADPINIMLSIAGDNVRLTPTESITVTVEDNDVYTVSFDREEITLEEGGSTNVRLSISPTPLSADTVTVILSASDNEQITVEPEEVVFSAASTNIIVTMINSSPSTIVNVTDAVTRTNVVVSAIDDSDKEGEETYAVRLSLKGDDNPPTRFHPDRLSVTVPDNDEQFPFAAVAASLDDEVLAEGDATILRLSLQRILLTTATLALDYDSELISLSDDRIIFASGETVSAIAVTALDNRLANADTRTAAISFSSQDANISPPDDIALSVKPDDRAAIAVYPTLLTIREGETGEVIFIIDPALAQRATITAAVPYLDSRQLSVSNGGQIVIPAEETQLSVTVAAADDDIRERQTDYTINFSATGHADLARDEITVRVPVDDRDIVEDIDDRDNEVAEDSPAGAEVGITVKVTTATDYTLTDDVGGLFAIDPQSGTVTVAVGMLDHEAFLFHTITAQAGDGISTHTASFTVWVADVPEPLKPVIDIDFNANEISYGAARGDTVGITARAVDPDRDSMVSYSLSEDAGGLFAIGRQDGIVTLASDGGRAERSHLIEVIAASSDGSTGSAQFTVRRDEPILIRVDPKATTIIEGESQDIIFSSVEGSLEAKGISAGVFRSCAIVTDNRVACWGSDSYRSTMPPAGRFVAVSAGERHNCAIAADNRAVCWGDNSHKQTMPVPDREFIAISVGREHSCGITAGNDAVCWGNDGDKRTMPPEGEKFVALSAGTRYNCGITPGNDAVCWGANLFGEARPPAGRKFIAISAGSSHSCAVTLDNDAICWGLDFTDSTLPPQDRKFIAVSAGSQHSCGITATNDAVCWGSDFFDVIRPSTDRKLIALSAGYHHSCGITDANGVVCWGSNEDNNNELIGQSSPPQIAQTAGASITVTATVSEMDREQISVSDNGQAVIPAGETQATLTVTAAADGLKEDTIDYTIDLNAAGPAALDTNYVLVTVVNDDRVSNPMDIDGAAGGVVAENSPEGTTVGITVRSFNATTYTLSDDAGGRFAINATGLVTVADGSLLDFEDAASHSITVEARNADSARAMQFTVNVTDVNEFDLTPLVDSDPAADQLPEDATTGAYTGITLSATDGDGSAVVTYRLLDSSGGLFLADTNTGVITLRGQLNYERSTRHTIIAQAMSSDGSAPTTAAFTILLIQTPPVVRLEDIDETPNLVAENSPAGATVGITARLSNATTYTLSDDAGGRFAINATGLVTVADGSLLNFEDAASHSITVQAGDINGGFAMSFIIQIGNENEITLRDRDNRNNFIHASTNAVAIGLELEAVHDDEAPITGWELRQLAGLLELTRAADSSTQNLKVKADAEDLSPYADTTTSLMVIARTRYDVTTETFAITLTEEEPVFIEDIGDADGDAGGAVAENSTEGATVGITIRATGATTYTLSDDAGGRFAISATGLVTVADGSLLNFEDATTHSITAQAANNISSQTLTLTIGIINVDEITLEDTDNDNTNNIAPASAGVTVSGLELRAIHADGDDITSWEITASTRANTSTIIDLFEFSEPQDSATQTLRIKTDADLASITSPTIISLGIRVQTASDEASEDFDIEVSPSRPTEGIRLRIRVYLEGALE